MGKPYSADLRERFARALGRGLPARAAARLLEVSESTGVKWAQRWRETGGIAAKAMGGDNSSRIKDEDADWVLALVAAGVGDAERGIGRQHGGQQRLRVRMLRA